jgi:hypothetical protein
MMRTAFLLLAVVFGLCAVASPAPTRGGKAAARTKKTHDAAAEAYKLEQQARLVYWVYTYRKTLVALKQGLMNPIRPYPRQAAVEELFPKMSPGARAYARKLQQLERRTMSQHAPDNTVNRQAVMRGIVAILSGLSEEQKLLDAMPVAY